MEPQQKTLKCGRVKMVCIGIGFTVLVVFVAIGIIFVQDVDAGVHKIVETNYGKVKGIIGKTFFKEKTYFAFKGIPFAKPPIGELRFKVHPIMIY